MFDDLEIQRIHQDIRSMHEESHKLISNLTNFSIAIYAAAIALYASYPDLLFGSDSDIYHPTLVVLEFFHAIIFTLPSFLCAIKFRPQLELSVGLKERAAYLRAIEPKNKITWEKLKKEGELVVYHQRDFNHNSIILKTKIRVFVGISYFSLILAGIIATQIVFNCLHAHDAEGLCKAFVDQCDWLLGYRWYYIVIIFLLFGCKFTLDSSDMKKTVKCIDVLKDQLNSGTLIREEQIKCLIPKRRRWWFIGGIYLFSSILLLWCLKEKVTDLDFNLQAYIFSFLFILLLIFCLLILPNFDEMAKIAEIQVLNVEKRISQQFRNRKKAKLCIPAQSAGTHGKK